MIVIFKNEKGRFSVRAAYIGFIRNNAIRRLLCTLFFPLILCVTIFINIVQAIVVCIFVLIRAVYYPISELKPIWKTEIWNTPRTKKDKNKTLN